MEFGIIASLVAVIWTVLVYRLGSRPGSQDPKIWIVDRRSCRSIDHVPVEVQDVVDGCGRRTVTITICPNREGP